MKVEIVYNDGGNRTWDECEYLDSWAEADNVPEVGVGVVVRSNDDTGKGDDGEVRHPNRRDLVRALEAGTDIKTVTEVLWVTPDYVLVVVK
jgi:hypothetical protein